MRRAAICLMVAAAVAASLAAHAAPAPVAPGPDRVYIDAVVDAMVESGVITQDQADKLKSRGQKALDTAAATKAAVPAKKKWYDTMKIGGYVQGRAMYYLDDIEAKDANGDKHRVGDEFLVRRARMALEAKPSATSKLYLQTDMGGGSATVKDAWVERSFARDLSSRVRIGQQKVPFGFEVPQSSGSRLPLERNWLTRRTIPEERDTGLTYYFTTPGDKALFDAAKASYWGTGDYGNIAVSLFNGQSIGSEGQEVNDNKHLVVRLCKPFEIKSTGGYAEVGASYYGGDYFSKAAKQQFDEHLFGIHGYFAPEPFGLQAEYFDGETEGHDLKGWYAMGLWKSNPGGVAFVRYDKLEGYRKGANAAYDRHRTGVGYAYQLDDNTRLTLEYDKEELDTASGGSADQIGLQIMVSY